MNRHNLLIICIGVLFASTVHANKTGIAGYSGVVNTSTCFSCHNKMPSPGTMFSFSINGPRFLQPNQKGTYTATLTTWPVDFRGGFDISADGGTLAVNISEPSPTKILQNELVHAYPKSTPTPTTGMVSWTFDWKAPSTNGTYTLHGYGIGGVGTPTDMNDHSSGNFLTIRVGLCESNPECNDKNPCTTDTCDLATSQCSYATKSGCCQANTDCTDDNPCTEGVCMKNLCFQETVAGCCTDSSTCLDNNPCTSDLCDLPTHTCMNAPIPHCCGVGGAPCNDGNSCTTDVCNDLASTCTYTPKENCCLQAADCADNNPCTTEVCTAVNGKCVITAVADCCQSDAECQGDTPCTAYKCQGNVCTQTPVLGCCVDTTDCDDSNPCTEEKCLFGICQYTMLDCPDPDAGATDAGTVEAGAADAGATDVAVAGSDQKSGQRDTSSSPAASKDGGCSLTPGPQGANLALLCLCLIFLGVFLWRRR